MEGNDPMETGDAIGTPSDMAAVGIGQDDAQTPPDTIAGSIFDPFQDDGEDERPEDEQGETCGWGRNHNRKTLGAT